MGFNRLNFRKTTVLIDKQFAPKLHIINSRTIEKCRKHQGEHSRQRGRDIRTQSVQKSVPELDSVQYVFPKMF